MLKYRHKECKHQNSYNLVHLHATECYLLLAHLHGLGGTYTSSIKQIAPMALEANVTQSRLQVYITACTCVVLLLNGTSMPGINHYFDFNNDYHQKQKKRTKIANIIKTCCSIKLINMNSAFQTSIILHVQRPETLPHLSSWMGETEDHPCMDLMPD